MDTEQFEERKRDHIRHSLNPAHQASGLSGLERVHLIHEALPEIDFSDIRIDAECLGQRIKTPFYVAGMTAGHSDAPQLNRTLALACAERGWAMGVGSQRRELEMGEGGTLDSWRKLRDEVPSLMVFANLGLSQVIGAPVSAIRRVVDSVQATALAIHVNALQEAMQPEGTPNFRGGIEALRRVCEELDLPVILKETGCGFSAGTLSRLSSIRLAAIDVSGLGGTHWGRIEGARASAQGQRGVIYAAAAETFASWGESTVDSVLAAKQALPRTEIWASGGVRSGLDAAKLIALGAHRVGYAKPALEAALKGAEELRCWMELQEYEFKVALFCTGSSTPSELRQRGSIWKKSVI